MLNVNVTHFQENLFALLEQTIHKGQPLHIQTKSGNAVVLSEEEYNNLLETLYLSQNPVMKKQILEGMQTPLSECIPADEVEW